MGRWELGFTYVASRALHKHVDSIHAEPDACTAVCRIAHAVHAFFDAFQREHEMFHGAWDARREEETIVTWVVRNTNAKRARPESAIADDAIEPALFAYYDEVAAAIRSPRLRDPERLRRAHAAVASREAYVSRPSAFDAIAASDVRLFAFMGCDLADALARAGEPTDDQLVSYTIALRARLRKRATRVRRIDDATWRALWSTYPIGSTRIQSIIAKAHELGG